MYRLIYVSSAVNLFSDEQLRQLLEISRHNNSQCGVTGLLLYADGNFIQVLEGDESTVLSTHQRIAKDSRHQGLITLMQGEIAQREFEGWSMGFKNIDSATGRDLPGYSDFLNKKAHPDSRRSAALILLEHFRNINR